MRDFQRKRCETSYSVVPSWALLRGLFRTCHLLNSSWHKKDTENAKGVMKLERFLRLLWTELRHFMVVWNNFARKHLQSGLFLERKHFQTFKLPKVWYFESQWLTAGEAVILCTTIVSLPSISYFALWTFFLPIAVMQRACKRAYELLCKGFSCFSAYFKRKESTFLQRQIGNIHILS